MRTREVLVEGFEEVKTLMQYLYMDEENSIIITNDITQFKITLDEALDARWTNLSFPHLGYTYHPMRLNEWLACVEQLKEQPSDCGYGNFSNKWEEIKTITLMQVALNKGV